MTSLSSYSNRVTVCVIAVLMCIFVSAKAMAVSGCSRGDAQRAEMEASSLKTWQQVFESYQRYRGCDDGAISEGYSSSIATLLASDWKNLEALLQLIRSHPDFEKFVLKHLDDTMTQDQDAEIQGNIRTSCPKDGARFCSAVQKRFAVLSSN